MKVKIEYVVLSILCVCMLIFGFSVLTSQKDTIAVNAELASGDLSNEKIGWGIKRAKDHKQPDLGSKNKQLIDKYNGIAMGNENNKSIYLTFDNGYEAGYTDKILDVLKNNDVTATFFVTAHYVNTAGDLVRKMIDNGNIVGNQFPTFLMDVLKS